jgi:hypothetical protein
MNDGANVLLVEASEIWGKVYASVVYGWDEEQ